MRRLVCLIAIVTSLGATAHADCLDNFDGNSIEMSARVTSSTLNGHGSFVLYHLADEKPQCDSELLLTTPIQTVCPAGSNISFTASVLERTIQGTHHAAARHVTCSPAP